MKRLALILSLSLLAACEPPAERCSAATCSTGCCDADGVCQSGGFPQQCGTSGFACQACASGSLCQFGQCVGGSTGGGTGGGGGSCTPRSCVTQGKTCGEIDDGCGGRLMCGVCEVPGESCGAGGVANVCAMGSCMPKTCTSLGRTCGSASDGCSAQLNCGTCSGSQVCSSAGTCQQNTCTPTTCQAQGKNCGMISDGCNGQLNCGTCMVSGQTCGGAGTVNVCGQGSCTPRTCTQANATCGTISDGCGNMIPCGSCAAPQTCGGAGTPNTCGAPCIGSCPTGFTCMAGDGACSGGSLTGVTFDIPVPAQHTVSGRITRNTLAPSSTNCTTGYSYGTLEFVHATDSRFNTSARLECSGATTFNFSLPLYPGTYKVTEKPTSYVNMTNLPTWDSVVSTAFTVTAPQANVAFDIPVPPQHTVSGVITRNSVAPSSTNCTTGYSYGTLEFVHATDSRFNTSARLECSGATTFNYSLPMYPGTYKVTEKPTSYVNMTNLPTWDTVVSTSFTVSAPQANVAFDIPVPPQHTISGRITRNTVAPSSTNCTTGYSYGTLEFVHATDQRFNTSARLECSGATTFNFSLPMYPGTYKVTEKPTSYVNMTNLPTWDTVVSTSFTVSAPQANVVFEVPVPPQHTVSGVVTRNGVAPSSTNCTTGYSYGTLEFVHATDPRFNTSARLECSGATTFNFSLPLYPGTYKVTEKPTSYVNMTNLPTWDTVVSTSFAVSAPQANVAFDIPVPPQHTVSGRITRNSLAPSSTNCTTGYSYGTLEFVHATDPRFNTSARLECSGATTFNFSLPLYPGTYKVTEKPTSYVNMTNLPTWDTVVSTAFTVAAPQANVAFDIPVPAQRTVSGVITRNGAAPSNTNCTTGYSYGTLEFTNAADQRFNASARLECSGATTFNFTVQLYPGTYKVTEKPTSYVNMTNLPTWDTVVVNALRIP